MKRVICAQDIEALIKQGETTLSVEAGTIVTPSAKDAAKAANLEICVGHSEGITSSDAVTADESQISKELIYSALKVMQMKNML